MERVQITIHQELLVVSFKQEHFQEQWDQWTLKLQQLTLFYQGKPEVFFHFPNLPMPTILGCLHQIQDEAVITGFSNKEMKQNALKIVHKKIRGGDPVLFEQGAVIAGDIEKDVFITLNSGNLYVLGTIRGKIECCDESSRIYCHKMEEAMICFKGIWQISTKLDGPIVYDRTTMSD